MKIEFIKEENKLEISEAIFLIPEGKAGFNFSSTLHDFYNQTGVTVSMNKCRGIGEKYYQYEEGIKARNKYKWKDYLIYFLTFCLAITIMTLIQLYLHK